MPLVVEDGSALSTAESYISAENATTYHAAVGNAAWAGADVADAQREPALRRATRYIDGAYFGRFTGYKSQQRQALQWPRMDAFDGSDFLIPSSGADSIPLKLRQATAEAALIELVTPGALSPSLERGGAILSKHVQAGPVQTSTTFSAGASTRTSYSVLSDLLADLLVPRGSRDLARA